MQQKISLESQIVLNKFKPRPYQLEFFRAMEVDRHTKALLNWHRRSGKDICAFNFCVRALLRRVGAIYYIFPTYSQGKKALWDAIDNDGHRIIDSIPPQLIASKNATEMKIKLTNGSLFQIVGSDNYNSLMGTNPMGVVFSEYALQDPAAYDYIRPILLVNGGWSVFVSTPRGKNGFYTLYEIASNNPAEWFCSTKTVDDTGVVTADQIQAELAAGTMSEDLIQQEFYCSFELGVEGAYYTKYLDKMRVNNQIGNVPWQSGYRVNTVFDLGVRDSTTIIWYQVIGAAVHIIDCYENKDVGLDHYIKVVLEKPYIYNKHFAPHDIGNREYTSGLARIDVARNMGINFTIVPNLSVQDGIEAVRSRLGKIWIDERKCKPLIKALESYRKEFNSKMNTYNERPRHDWACFEGSTLVLTRSGMRPIKSITKDDYILTQRGWLQCNDAKKTGINAQLVEVKFKDGTKVKCTPEHLFLTENGWKSAEALTKGTKIQSALTNLSNILTDIYTDCGLVKNILQKAEKDYIEMFGRGLLEKLLKDVIYITKTLIRQTINFETSNASQLKFTVNCLKKIKQVLIKKLEMLRQSGTDQKLGGNGISDTLCEVSHGQFGKEKFEDVCSVINNLIALSEKMEMSKSFVIQIAKPLIIDCVTKLNETADVYCINVPLVHHFSLSNGAIVHNSHFADAMRYLVLSLGKAAVGDTADDVDRRYYEARYGADYTGNNFFNNQGV